MKTLTKNNKHIVSVLMTSDIWSHWEKQFSISKTAGRLAIILFLTYTDIACGQNNLALYYLQDTQPIEEQDIYPMAAYYIAANNTVVDWLMDGIIIYDIHQYVSFHPQQSTCDTYINNLFGAGARRQL